MLRQHPIKSILNDFDRSWITDDYFDLFVWYEADRTIHGFQLCYGKPVRERALTWTRKNGYRHSSIDSGEQTPEDNRTPMLLATDEVFDAEPVRKEFCLRSLHIDSAITTLILAKIDEYHFMAGRH